MRLLFQGPLPDVWSHDKFSETPRNMGGAARGAAGTGKLLISNLDFGVNDSDINVSMLFNISVDTTLTGSYKT